MPVQKNIDLVGRLIGRNVLKTEFQSTAYKIEDQWPFKIAVAIAAYDSEAWPDRAKLIENAFHTDISKMPNFVCTLSQFLHLLRQAIVRVRQDENAQRLLFRSFLVRHVPSENPAREKLHNPGTVSSVLAARCRIVTRCTAEESEVRISIWPAFAAPVAT
jgi:hypothetical protein